MSDQNEKNGLGMVIGGVGSSLILIGMAAFTQLLWTHGIENHVFAANISTALFLGDHLSFTTEAAPYALVSMNWFLANCFEKEFRLWAKKRFS